MPNMSANRMSRNEKAKNACQVDLEVEEYLDRMLKEPDDFVSANDYLSAKNTQRPPEFFEYMTPFDDELDEKQKETKALKSGDIVQLLTNTPGALGYSGRFPKSVGNEIDDLPGIITNGAIPIFLDSKFFSVKPDQSSENNIPLKSNGAAKKQPLPYNSNKSDNDSHPTIYACDKPRKADCANVRQNPEYFNPFEIYKLKRVSADFPKFKPIEIQFVCVFIRQELGNSAGKKKQYREWLMHTKPLFV